MLLFCASSVFMGIFFEIPMPAVIIEVILLCFLFFRIKLDTKIIKLPVIYHFIALLAFAYLSTAFYHYADGTKLYVIFFSAACGIFFFSLIEIVSSAILSFLSDGAHPESFLKAMAVIFPLLFTVIIYIPSETYFINSKDFLFVFFDFAPYIIIKAVVFTLITSVAACALSSKVFRVFSALTTGLTLCVYCQYIFMNSDLPSFLGTPPDWSSMHAKIVINLVIWILLLLLPLAFILLSGRIKAISGNKIACNAHVLAGLFIGGIQLISLVTLIITSDRSLSIHEKYMLNNKEQFVVSGNKNVITFILDASDRHYFDDVYEQEPERFDFLNDFTYYNNACMMFDATYLSIPQMLSGAVDPPENDIDTWVNKCWSSERCTSFYSRLHDADYKVNVFGDFSSEYKAYSESFDNCEFQTEDSIKIKHKKLYSELNALSAYRYMPMLLKSSFFGDVEELNRSIEFSNECIMDNKQYLSSLKLGKAKNDKNYFIVEHLNGTHTFSGGTVTERVYDCLDILKEYTDQLKEMGLYDSSVIIITGDHGKHYGKDNVPIWYIKGANEHHDRMQTSSAPIHHTDYLATCIDAAGLKQSGDDDLLGRSIFDIPENEKRKRLVFQRYGFEYEGDIDFKRCVDPGHKGAAYGYYFTGNREDLVKRENAGPPDIVLELNDMY